jgi:hypothetical protein
MTGFWIKLSVWHAGVLGAGGAGGAAAAQVVGAVRPGGAAPRRKVEPAGAEWAVSEVLGGPVQQPGADHRGLEQVTVGRAGGVGAGEFVDAFQAVGQGAHAEGEAAGGFGGDAARVEVGGEGVQERLRAAAGPGERTEGVPDEVGHGLAVSGKDRVDEQVGRAQHRIVQFQALGQLKHAQRLLVGVDDPAGTGLGAANGDPAAVGGGVRLLGEVGNDHYTAEAQTLTTGAEANLPKLAELRGTLTTEQAARWSEVKAAYVRAQALGGPEGDHPTAFGWGDPHLAALARAVAALGLLADRIAAIESAINRAGDPRNLAANTAARHAARPTPVRGEH